MFRFVTFYVFYALLLAQLVCSAIAEKMPLYSPVKAETVRISSRCKEIILPFICDFCLSYFGGKSGGNVLRVVGILLRVCFSKVLSILFVLLMRHYMYNVLVIHVCPVYRTLVMEE